MTSVVVIFVLLAVYQLKHFVADYILQGEYMLGKFKGGTAWILPLLAHVGVHAGLTALIAATVFDHFKVPMSSHGLNVLAAIMFFDAGVHFVMDRIKASPSFMGRWKPVTAAEYVDCKRVIVGEKAMGVYGNTWTAERRLFGNKLFWWALGFDQMVHHLTHYACIYFIVHFAGVL